MRRTTLNKYPVTWSFGFLPQHILHASGIASFSTFSYSGFPFLPDRFHQSLREKTSNRKRSAKSGGNFRDTQREKRLDNRFKTYLNQHYSNSIKNRTNSTKSIKPKYILKGKPVLSPMKKPLVNISESFVIEESKTKSIITPVQRIGLAIYSAFSALENPKRGDMIALLGDTTGYFALKGLHKKMLRDPVGKKILETKPIINSEVLFPFMKDQNIDEIKIKSYYPENSLGYEYFLFMKKHHFDPDDRTPVRYIEDSELAYVMTRYRQVHDFLHVLTDIPPTVLGEIGLKWFECIMTGLPSTTISALVGPLRLNREERTFLVEKLIPWAVTYGRRAVPLTCIDFESILYLPLEETRKMIGIVPAPSFKAKL